MSNFTDFISDGGSASFPTFFLHNSQTWVPPQDGNIMIHVIGAGGSGTGHTSNTQVQSGAAGGYCRKNSLAVTTSGSFTVVIGAGGASRIGSNGAGVAGGNTTVAGTGLGSTLTANGGAAGAVNSGAFTVGGTASNGDVNYAGGRGGYQKGGGAVGLTGTGADGSLTSANAFTASYGGDCDVIGDFYSSSYGKLSGSGGSMGQKSGQTTGPFSGPGPLGGAGSVYDTAAIANAGHASIGGGGGWSSSNTTIYIYSGRGGEGCVVIQYIP